MTLAEKLDQMGKRPAGFDYMRLILALSVFSYHTIVTTYGHDFQQEVLANPYYYSLFIWILPAFFCAQRVPGGS